MIQVKSKEEAIEWATRCPASENEIIEVRQVQEMADFPADVQKAAEGFTEMQQALSRLRREHGQPTSTAASTRSGASNRRRSSPRWRAWCATSAWPRSWRRTRWSPRSSSGRATACPTIPAAWLMTAAKHRALDQLRRRKLHAEQGRRDRPRARCAARDGGGRLRRGRRCRARRRRGRRPAAPGVHRLPPGAVDRGARRADAAPARRPHHRRDRARLPGAGADHRAAHRARQAHAGRGARALRGAARATSWRRASPRCSK